MRHLIMAISLFLGLMWVGTAAHAQGGNYLIGVGDTLNVEVLEDGNLNRNVLVTPDGRVSFPLAGTIQASGRTVGQVERALSSALAENFAAPPTVFVSVTGIPQREPVAEEDTASVIVYVVGEVNEPGPKAVIPGTTVLQLLSQSGGFTPFAATKRLQLRRNQSSGQQQLIKIDYRAISRGATIIDEPILREGDVLLVPERRLFE